MTTETIAPPQKTFPRERGETYCIACGRSSATHRGSVLVCTQCGDDETVCRCRPTVEYRMVLALEQIVRENELDEILGNQHR